MSPVPAVRARRRARGPGAELADLCTRCDVPHADESPGECRLAIEQQEPRTMICEACGGSDHDRRAHYDADAAGALRARHARYAEMWAQVEGKLRRAAGRQAGQPV